MKAVFFDQHGDIDKLKHGEVPEPDPGKHRVLVRIEKAALNHLDLWVLGGLPRVKLRFPHIPGADGAGTVLHAPEGAGDLREGDRVLLNPGISCGHCELCRAGEHSMCATFHLLGENVNGTFAEIVAVPRLNVFKIPDHVDMEEAAAFPLTYCTAWRMLMNRARLKPGETVLILGIGGGTSLAALQIAHRAGARTIVTSGASSKLERAAALGADHGINHAASDFAAEVKMLTDGRGVDVVVENVGQATWEKSLQCLRKGGRLVTCGATTGPEGKTAIPLVYWKQLTIIGSTMASHGDFHDMLRFVCATRLKPVIDSRFDLSDAPSAYRRMKDAAQFGKIVLHVA